jgi:hypothetical protein
MEDIDSASSTDFKGRLESQGGVGGGGMRWLWGAVAMEA